MLGLKKDIRNTTFPRLTTLHSWLRTCRANLSAHLNPLYNVLNNIEGADEQKRGNSNRQQQQTRRDALARRTSEAPQGADHWMAYIGSHVAPSQDSGSCIQNIQTGFQITSEHKEFTELQSYNSNIAT